jgi:hypothetical protein
MAYTKTTWLDRAVQFASRYTKSGETSTEVTLTASPGTVTQAGTPANATNLNKLEQGVADAHTTADAAIPKISGVMRRTPPTTNLNDAIAPGIYLLGTDSTYTNGCGMDYCTLTVHSTADAGYIIQEVVQVLSPYQRKYRMRTESASGWGAWQYVWDSSKLRMHSSGLYVEFYSTTLGGWFPVGGGSAIQATYTRTATMNSTTKAPRIWHTIVDIQNKRGVIFHADAGVGIAAWINIGDDYYQVGSTLYIKLTLDDQVETITRVIPNSSPGGPQTWQLSQVFISDVYTGGGDYTYTGSTRQDSIYFMKNFKLEVYADPTQSGYTNSNLNVTSTVRYALHVGS